MFKNISLCSLRYFIPWLFVLPLVLFSGLWVTQLQAQSPTVVTIEVLSRKDCTHCQDEEKFFRELSMRRADFTVKFLDLIEPDNKNLWEEVTTLDALPKVTPITLVGDTIIQGFGTEKTTGVQIEELIDYYQANPSQVNGFKAYVASGGSKRASLVVADGTCTDECVVPSQQSLLTQVALPFGKYLNIATVSLPVLAAVLGFVDGFNPCAMWVLVTFLLILVQLKSRKKMFYYAGVFILAEAIMYSLILTVWYTTWDFVGLDKIVTPLVGLVALGGGTFFLYEWRTSKAGECKVTNLSQRQKFRSKIQRIINKPLTISTIFGIIAIAFSVNVIEFACSIGIPQTFTKILELNQLNLASTIMMIAIYISMYMVDDFIVFGIALYSFDKIGLTNKYSKFSNLVGGILLLVLGAILILNPQVLQIFS